VHETPGIGHVAILHFVLGISSRQKHVNDGSDCMICFVVLGDPTLVLSLVASALKLVSCEAFEGVLM
jgi:hypothetical protein